MSLRKIGKNYYSYYRDENGVQHTIATKCTDLVSAQKFDRIVTAAIQAKKQKKQILKYAAPETAEQIKSAEQQNAPDQPTTPVHKRGSIRIDAMYDHACKFRKLSDTHRKIWSLFVRSCGCTYADQITRKKAVEYLASKYSEKAAKTYNNSIGILNTVFKLCLVETGLETSPFEGLPKKRLTDVVHHRPLTLTEFKKAFSVCAIQWQTVALISWHTGQRLETCKRIAAELYLGDKDAITIKPGKTARFGRSVYIPLHTELRSWMSHLRETVSPADFADWSFSNTYFTGVLKTCRILDTAEGKASFHSLRVSFITRCDEAQITRSATRGVVGQVSDNTTDLYSYDKESSRKILSLSAAGILM